MGTRHATRSSRGRRYTAGRPVAPRSHLRGWPFHLRRSESQPARGTPWPMSTNVSQNYPYSSETESDRRAAVAEIVPRFDGLAAKIDAESTPLDAPETADVG